MSIMKIGGAETEYSRSIVEYQIGYRVLGGYRKDISYGELQLIGESSKGKIVVEDEGKRYQYKLDALAVLYLYNNRYNMLHECGRIFICHSSSPFKFRQKRSEEACILTLENDDTLTWHEINSMDPFEYLNYIKIKSARRELNEAKRSYNLKQHN